MTAITDTITAATTLADIVTTCPSLARELERRATSTTAAAVRPRSKMRAAPTGSMSPR